MDKSGSWFDRCWVKHSCIRVLASITESRDAQLKEYWAQTRDKENKLRRFIPWLKPITLEQAKVLSGDHFDCAYMSIMFTHGRQEQVLEELLNLSKLSKEDKIWLSSEDLRWLTSD